MVTAVYTRSIEYISTHPYAMYFTSGSRSDELRTFRLMAKNVSFDENVLKFLLYIYVWIPLNKVFEFRIQKIKI